MTDSTRVFDPGFRVTDSNGDIVSGAKIKFYAGGTTTPRTVYSDSGLSSSLGSTVYCGSDGVPVASQGSSTEVSVYTGTTDYKVVITDDSDVEILTYDNLSGALDTSNFLTTASTSTLSLPVVSKTTDYTIVAADRGKVINANPTGGSISLTMTAATTLGDGWSVKVKHSGTVSTVTLATSQTFAYSGITSTSYTLAVGETVEVVCDAAGFHIVNAIFFPILPPPQGYLTLTSGTPVISTDATAQTAVYYTPFVGNLIPVWNGARFMPTVFSEMTLSLSASHSANGIYDVFVFNDSGTLRLVTGPVWSTVTAGSGARGAGVGTTELQRTTGFWVNKVAMTGRNGNTTYSVSAGYATYLGSVFIDGSNGQISCHVSYGQSRKWGVWNAYNRQPIVLKAGDSTATWSIAGSSFAATRGTSANSVTVFCGLAEERFEFSSKQYATGSTSGSTATHHITVGIGFNSTTVASGFAAGSGVSIGTSLNFGGRCVGEAAYSAPPSIGVNVATMLEKYEATTLTAEGTEATCLMTARWRG